MPDKMAETTYSREYLLDLPAKRRRDAISSTVFHMQSGVIEAAKLGNTSHLIQLDASRNPIARSYPPPYIPTADDLIEGFRNKFPDCRVEYAEIWEEVRPGVRQQKKGILIDWS
jgi:hypothetical protein